jgi:hypothetical protein
MRKLQESGAIDCLLRVTETLRNARDNLRLRAA